MKWRSTLHSIISKNLWVFLILVGSSQVCAQEISFQDSSFRNYLLDNLDINVNNDNIIDRTEALNFSGKIDCTGKGITSLRGIEAFKSLSELYCFNNPIDSLDLTSNLKLKNIGCGNGILKHLVLPSGDSLEYLDCSLNYLEALDVSKNPNLVVLRCFDNKLQELELNNHGKLWGLDCFQNSLTSLDLSSCISLEGADCAVNNLSQLILPNTDSLLTLYCFLNRLTQLDVSNCKNLKKLSCYSNLITELDITHNTSLTVFSCADNLLNRLDMANGNNRKITEFWATMNPTLECINVDDEVWSSSNWLNIDGVSSFSKNCYVSINDITKENEVKIFPNPTSEYVSVYMSDGAPSKIAVKNHLGQVLLVSYNSDSVNVASLTPGVYFIHLLHNGKTYSRKFTKE